MFKDNLFSFLKKGKLYGQEFVNLATHLQNLPISVSMSGTALLETNYAVICFPLHSLCLQKYQVSFPPLVDKQSRLKCLEQD